MGNETTFVRIGKGESRKSFLCKFLNYDRAKCENKGLFIKVSLNFLQGTKTGSRNNMELKHMYTFIYNFYEIFW